ncbi:type IV pilin protein [Tahibacter caeni]|uniref:type IV pilin protein n=1 Tax=Tahibacter caeni TaxID=1453545 RepID=UPI00214773AF|nr:type IV pilin protein [Tahibacter caeni]
MYKRSKSGGFTLLELMIVVVIIAMLASFAMPAYQRYSQRARRADGKELLMRVAAAQERYYTNFNRYAVNPLTGATSLGLSSLTSERGYYTISSANGATGNTQSYVLSAIPVPGGPQAADQCGTLTVNNTGVKTPAANAMPQNSNGACW